MKRVTILLILLAVAILLVACGGVAPGLQPVALSFEGLDSFDFTPPTASVASGADVTVTFTNAGVLDHDWMLIPEGVEPTTATEADAIPGAHSGILQSGEVNTFTFTAPAAGTYQYICTVPGHAAGGMIGRLNVTN